MVLMLLHCYYLAAVVISLLEINKKERKIIAMNIAPSDNLLSIEKMVTIYIHKNDCENKFGTENSCSFSSHVYCVYDLTCYPFHCYRANLGSPFLIRKMIKCDDDGDLLFYICFYIYN